jgi:ribosomal protein S18 acetylase RimI-like enzyme
MTHIQIRQCRTSDKKEIINVCYHCGYYGEDATSYFSDKKLFGLLFCSYYPEYEPENGFVAVIHKHNEQKIIGYALSSLNTKQYEERYNKKIKWRILLRLYFYTFWRFHHDYKIVHRFLKKSEQKTKEEIDEMTFWEEYTAHLHIDVLKAYQRQGIGSKLIKTLENHLISQNIKGVCLGTSEKNEKSIPFYKKHDYELLQTSKGLGFWSKKEQVKSLYFGKRFD